MFKFRSIDVVIESRKPSFYKYQYIHFKDKIWKQFFKLSLYSSARYNFFFVYIISQIRSKDHPRFNILVKLNIEHEEVRNEKICRICKHKGEEMCFYNITPSDNFCIRVEYFKQL